MKLEVGYNSGFEVRKECYTCSIKGGFSIVYLSDFHFNGFCKNIGLKIAEKIGELDPDIVLLGGDYSDTNKGLFHLDGFMNAISHRKNVFAIAGNHDYYLGLEKIKEIITRNNGYWIEKESYSFEVNNTKIKVDGNNPKITHDSDFNILCLHKPIDLIKSYSDHYHLVFAGHLHGSQFVFWKTRKGLYPGRLFYKWNVLSTRLDSCLYLISKGLGDTLPVRYNCARDIIYVNVSSQD